MKGDSTMFANLPIYAVEELPVEVIEIGEAQ